MKIGIMGELLGVPWDTIYEKAAELGFDGIEPGIRAQEWHESPLSNIAGRQAILEKSRQSKVETCSLCLHGWGGAASSHSEGDRVQAVAVLKGAVDAASELGAGVILIPLNAPGGLDYDVAFERWVSALKAVTPDAEARGVRLGMESVGTEHTQSAERFERLMEAINSPAVGVYFDFVNAIYQRYDPLAMISLLGQKIFQVHAKQFGEHLLDDGPIWIDKIFAALASINYDGYIVLETSPMKDPIDSALRNLRAIRRYIS